MTVIPHKADQQITSTQNRRRSWCSIIIPTLNEEKSLPATLNRLKAAKPSFPVEIIIADGGSTDRTLEIATAHGCTTVHCTSGRARQLNAGARIARGDYLWFLHADTLPPPDWPQQLQLAKRTKSVAAFPIKFDHAGPYSPLRLFAWMSRFDVDAFRFGDQTLFVAATEFRAVNGYREDLSLLEDNDIVRRLRKGGSTLKVLNGHVVTSARRYHRHGIIFTQVVYTSLYLGYRLGLADGLLSNWYRRAFGDVNGGHPQPLV